MKHYLKIPYKYYHFSKVGLGKGKNAVWRSRIFSHTFNRRWTMRHISRAVYQVESNFTLTCGTCPFPYVHKAPMSIKSFWYFYRFLHFCSICWTTKCVILCLVPHRVSVKNGWNWKILCEYLIRRLIFLNILCITHLTGIVKNGWNLSNLFCLLMLPELPPMLFGFWQIDISVLLNLFP